MKKSQTQRDHDNLPGLEQYETVGKLNEVITLYTPRENGSVRVQQDFTYCPTLTEQHTAHLSDLNYLVEKYKPDELAAYIQARTMHRTEILGHDFSTEPNLQESQNTIYKIRQAFSDLPEDIRVQFKNHVEFMKFIDNPDNQAKMLKLGLLKPKQIKELTGENTVNTENTTMPKATTKEEPKAK